MAGSGTKPTHQLPFSSKIDQFCGGAAISGGGGTTIAANATTLFQPQGTYLHTYKVSYSSLFDIGLQDVCFYKVL